MIFLTMETNDSERIAREEHIALERNKKLDDYLQLITQGNQQALAGLYESTHTAVYGFVLSICRNVPDAEDILQDVYLKIWQNAASYSSCGKPMAWIFTIARNLALMCLRQNSHTTTVSPEEWQRYFQALPGTSPEDSLLLTALLSQLNDSERQILTLHALTGFRHREIAGLLDLPLSTVLSKYHRSLKKLRKLLPELC